MRFVPADPNQNLDRVRFVSEGGRWEFGVRTMLFGYRVSLSRIGDGWYTLDYCAAAQEDFLIELFLVMATILNNYPEDVTQRQLQDDFPRFRTKPINKDPYCWDKLKEMAGVGTLDKSSDSQEEPCKPASTSL